MEKYEIGGKEYVILTADEYNELTDGPKNIFEAYRKAKDLIRMYDDIKHHFYDVWPHKKEKEALNNV